MTHTVPQPDVIRDLLGRGTMWRSIESVASTTSTNADMAAHARRGEPEGRVLIASEQTAGRGRLDRTWVSPRGASLSLSMLLRPEPDFLRWGWLSLLTGMAVASALCDTAPDPTRVELKWPNDVLIDGGKVCGILSERVEHPTGARAVVGLGLNLELRRNELPVPSATSLSLEGFPIDREQIVAGVLRHMERLYRRWQDTGSLEDEYRARCTSVGSDLSITVAPETVVQGRGHGVDEFGRLQVATATGIRAFAVGDVVHARLHR
ncbi:biotin--[acetyl-CoA-carboxylase] ligase [Tessaracoccus sp.]